MGTPETNKVVNLEQCKNYALGSLLHAIALAARAGNTRDVSCYGQAIQVVKEIKV